MNQYSRQTVAIFSRLPDFNKSDFAALLIEFPGKIYTSKEHNIVAIAFNPDEEKEKEIILSAQCTASIQFLSVCNLKCEYNVCAAFLNRNYQLQYSRILKTAPNFNEAKKTFSLYDKSHQSHLSLDENALTINRKIYISYSDDIIVFENKSLMSKIFTKKENQQ